MTKIDIEEITNLSALLVHASRLDENYTNEEQKIILNFINKKISNNNAEDILKKAEILENDSNHILNFTRILKNKSLEFKSDIVKELWKIILSDNSEDQFENNLMRRLCGLIYFEDKMSGEIKMQVLKELK